MTYQDKVKASKEVLTAIEAMGDGEVIEFTYGTVEHWKTKEITPKVYELRCRVYTIGGKAYSVSAQGSYTNDSMNIDKITSTTLRLYTYDMFRQRTTYSLPLYEMKIGITITETSN